MTIERSPGDASCRSGEPLPESAPAEGETSDETNETDEEARVRELRKRVASGDYRVDPAEIARRLLERGDLDEHSTADPPRPDLRSVERSPLPEDETDDPGGEHTR